jgi:uncharacterized NAD(P)/FAD-binding protein YdhS
MSTPTAVAVIGAGASGTLTAAQLARSAARADAAVDIILIDPAPAGQGLAYSTTDPRHRLNVPAKAMSAWPDDPGHFLRWLRRHVAVDFPADGFAPRLHYAQYLASVLDAAAAESPQVRIAQIMARATDLRSIGRRLRVSLDDGTSRPADAVVLAVGHDEPSTTWAPADLVRAPEFVPDPWRAGAPTVRPGDEVVLVGAGLTAVDMAQRWGREGVRVHVVSRHGMLPLPHSAVLQPPAQLSIASAPTTLAELRRLVFGAIRAADGDWRVAIDGLRPATGRLWRGLDPAARRDFLRSAVRRWDRVRHRVDPAVHAWVEQRRAEGSLVTHAAHVDGVERVQGRLHVTLSNGASVPAAGCSIARAPVPTYGRATTRSSSTC